MHSDEALLVVLRREAGLPSAAVCLCGGQSVHGSRSSQAKTNTFESAEQHRQSEEPRSASRVVWEVLEVILLASCVTFSVCCIVLSVC